MPAIVALAVRYIIMAAVQLGLWALIEKYGIPLINNAIQAIMTAFGVSKDEAQTIMGNKVIRGFEEVGIFALTLKSKLPIRVAEILGFTTKGFKIAAITSKAGLAAEKIVVTATSKAPTSAAELSAVTKAVSEKSGWAINGVADLLKYVTLFVGTPVGFFYAFAQYVDYSAWQNPYQKTFQGLLSFIGIKPDTALPSSKVISAETWKRIYATVEQLKPLGISFPFSDKDTIYSRENLAKLVDEIAANMVAQGTDPTYKNVMAVLLLQLQFGGKEPKVPNFTTNSPLPSSTSVKTSTTTVSTPSVKVFTGVVSQGTVGGDFLFTPRQDDLIENAQELQTAVNNNVAPYLASLLSQVVYEIKVVSNVVSNGVRLTGTTQRIQSGNYTNGQPKYKTVTNKFAVADLYLKRDGGTRTKLTSIVLGPTNAANFQPTQNDLVNIALAVPKNLLTSNTDDISAVVSGTPTLSVSPASPLAAVSEPSIGYTFVYDGYLGAVSFNTATVDRLRKEIASGQKDIETAMRELAARTGKTFTTYGVEPTGEDSWANQNPNVVMAAFNQAPEKIRALLTTGGTFTGTPNQSADEGPPSSGVSSTVFPSKSNIRTGNTLPPAALSASTLFEFYTSQGKVLPSLAERGTIYQSLGLGQATFYTGTAEQNTKLLYMLQGDPL